LLDALEALGAHREAIIVVGAQAIYMYTGEIELAVAELTIDADLTIDPTMLQQTPAIESAMATAGFDRGARVGAWATTRNVDGVQTIVEIDLMVPEALSGGGRRAARLPGHAKEVARKARGLEACLIDKRVVTISALNRADGRTFTVAVAGPAALLVAKLHKIGERASERQQRRLDDKDALDVLRLLRAADPEDLGSTLVSLLDDGIAGQTTHEALVALRDLFADPRAPGSQMAGRAVGALASQEEIVQSCAALANELLETIDRLRQDARRR
jgi:hypothetical protein